MQRNKLLLEINLPAEKEQEVRARITSSSEDGRLPCGKALAIANSLKVPAKVVGMIADQMGIRVAQCQLGCF